ncbi:MAG: sodium:solute symporter family protein [Thermoprotei archaeon]|nr:MAG: sodium:solute symporter family protein [Thermoprotei archaeon]
MIVLIVLLVYFIIGTLIAYYSRKMGIKDSFDYYVGGYRLSGFLSAMTYAATTYSAFMMIGLVGFVYATGIGAFGFENLYLMATIVLLTFFAPKVWKIARERKWISPAEMLGDLYGSRILSMIVSIVYLVALMPYATAQLVGLGNLFSGMGLGYELGVLFGAIIVFLWTYIAGLWSIATTDAFQGLWMIASAIIFLLWVILFLTPSAGITPSQAIGLVGDKGLLGITSFWSFPVFLAYTVPWIFFAVTNPQVVQRIYMPRDIKALRRMITYFAIFGLFYTVIVTIIGIYARALTFLGLLPDLTSKRDMVTPTLLSLVHPVLAAIVFTSIVAAAISTLDSIILTISSSISRDFYGKIKGYGRELYVGYITIIALVLVVTIMALHKPGFVVELSVLSSVILLPLAPITILAWSKPELARNMGDVAILTLLVNVSIGIYAALVLGPKKAFIETIMNAPLSLWILLLSTIMLAIGIYVKRKIALKQG